MLLGKPQEPALEPHPFQVISVSSWKTGQTSQRGPLSSEEALRCPSCFSIPLASANAIILCRVCAGTSYTRCSASPGSQGCLWASGIVSHALRKGGAWASHGMECWDRDSPSAVSGVWGCSEARVEQELWEWRWVGTRVVYGLTATFPATGNILARDTLRGGRGGMPVKCGDKLPCSSE